MPGSDSFGMDTDYLMNVRYWCTDVTQKLLFPPMDIDDHVALVSFPSSVNEWCSYTGSTVDEATCYTSNPQHLCVCPTYMDLDGSWETLLQNRCIISQHFSGYRLLSKWQVPRSMSGQGSWGISGFKKVKGHANIVFSPGRAPGTDVTLLGQRVFEKLQIESEVKKTGWEGLLLVEIAFVAICMKSLKCEVGVCVCGTSEQM